MTLKIFRIASVVISLAIMITIFCFSAQSANESSQTSSGFIASVVDIIVDDFSELSDADKQQVINQFQFIFRKLAHFAIFTVLGFFVMLSLVSYEGISRSLRVLIALSISIIYAASDEVHQLFVEGRSCELRDFLIDCVGALFGVAIAIAIVFALAKRISWFDSRPT